MEAVRARELQEQVDEAVSRRDNGLKALETSTFKYIATPLFLKYFPLARLLFMWFV